MDISLEQRINDDIKGAMLAKDAVKLAALRAVKAAILVEKTAGSDHNVTDADVIKIMHKLVKQRKDSARLYDEAGRSELAENELAEAACIEEYLPRQLSFTELEDAVRNIVAETKAASPADMGKVMGVATKRLAGIADGKALAEAVKRLLAAGAEK